jgi:hypothetical protein
MSGQLRSTINKLDLQFYICLLTNRRYIGGVLSSICYAIVSVSFDTTLPIHVGEVFQWGSLQTGILFAILQGPNAFFSVPVKWLKDRVGSRYPTSVGFLGLAGLLWLAGTPGDDRFPWANLGYRGPIIYVAAIAAMGIFMTLLNGNGMMEAASKQPSGAMSDTKLMPFMQTRFGILKSTSPDALVKKRIPRLC